MLVVAKPVINDITAKKEFKMRRYELSDEEWQILDDLMYVLRVSTMKLVHCCSFLLPI